MSKTCHAHEEATKGKNRFDGSPPPIVLFSIGMPETLRQRGKLIQQPELSGSNLV